MLYGTGVTSVLSAGYEGIAYNNGNPLATIYCQAQPQLSAQLKAELALFPLDPAKLVHNNCYCSTWSKVGSTKEKSRNTVKYLKFTSEQRIDQNSKYRCLLRFTMVMVTINWDSNFVKPARN